ncbi:hypothetical protein GCM10023115_28190 [Pontixanthobacter gangjinensis]
MNIKLDRFRETINIILVDKEEIFWLQIPANTFTDIESNFKIWEAKNAVDIHISADRNDRYMKDIASGGFLIDFKSFVKERIAIPAEYIQEESTESNKPIRRRASVNLPKIGQKILLHNQSNISYKSLFEKYLEGATRITIQDPYIRYHHQFENLVEFCQILEDVKQDNADLHFELVTWNSEEFKDNSREYLKSLKDSLNESGINFTYKFEDKHDRFIQTDTGWKIILGRGLDIFHKVNSKISLAHRDQTKRRCKACEITYLRV